MKKKIFSLIFFIHFLMISFYLPADKLRYRENIQIELSRAAVISMVTVYPGDEVYSLFGHSSFRVLDPVNGVDWMFNYGTFDFDDPMFVPKFVKGQLDYYLAVDDFQRAFRFYSDFEKRKIVEQILNLDYEEKKTVFSFLMENSRTENRYYKYDFIDDNCSTRISDALIKCFGDNIRFPGGRGKSSFRKMIASYLTSYPFLASGIEVVLGSPSDRIPECLEQFFLPVPMIGGFDQAVLITENTGDKGKALVNQKYVFNEGIRKDSEVLNYPFYLFSAFFLFSLYVLYHSKRGIKSRFLKTAVTAADTVFLFAAGLSGLLIFYLWFVSDHHVPDWNFHILWLSPLSVFYLFLSAAGRWKSLPLISLAAARVLFISSLLFLLMIITGVQSLSYTLLPLYLSSLLIYFRRGEVNKIRLFKALSGFLSFMHTS